MISDGRLYQLRKLIASGQEAQFYSWTEWLALRPDVLRLDQGECQRCKQRGRQRAARIVHHVKHLRDRPDLALSIYDPDTGERQLICVCKRCHEELHPESLRPFRRTHAPVTEERWD